MHGLEICHLTVILWMLSVSCRSTAVINTHTHLSIDQAVGKFCSDHREFEIMALSCSSWRHAPLLHLGNNVPIEVSVVTCTTTMDENDLQLSFIIPEWMSNDKPSKHDFLELKHENDLHNCSRHSRRGLVQEYKRTVFAYTHGLFIT